MRIVHSLAKITFFFKFKISKINRLLRRIQFFLLESHWNGVKRVKIVLMQIFFVMTWSLIILLFFKCNKNILKNLGITTKNAIRNRKYNKKPPFFFTVSVFIGWYDLKTWLCTLLTQHWKSSSTWIYQQLQIRNYTSRNTQKQQIQRI